ncbi:extensin [Sitophilus oryzae]|uniref:Extensin n=1 Tax=Sitophilus oryzae TaxID=7048 RepID=A0A6J2X500_SITOR|nr:extensin [Sitophilus oryzae]
MKIFVLLLAVVAYSSAQKGGPYTTPVPILKQIDKHNDDGSYSYGYENADGTYKIETKYPTGEVYGKYGYIDDRGSLREVEYGASKRGFEPAGTDVTVAPPTLVQSQDAQRPLGPDEEDDGQYREDPAIYYQNDPEFVPKSPSYNSYERPSYEMSYTPSTYTRPAQAIQPAYTPPKPAYTPTYQPPAPVYNPPAPRYNDYYNNRVNNYSPPPQYNYAAPQPSYWNPSPQNYPGFNAFRGSPAQNVDIWTGSYTVNYR